MGSGDSFQEAKGLFSVHGFGEGLIGGLLRCQAPPCPGLVSVWQHQPPRTVWRHCLFHGHLRIFYSNWSHRGEMLPYEHMEEARFDWIVTSYLPTKWTCAVHSSRYAYSDPKYGGASASFSAFVSKITRDTYGLSPSSRLLGSTNHEASRQRRIHQHSCSYCPPPNQKTWSRWNRLSQTFSRLS